MSKLTFPPGKKILENKICTNNFLELTLSEIREAREFTGFLKLDREAKFRTCSFSLRVSLTLPAK